MNCHDHQSEKLWATTKDGPPPKGHINSLKQLESAKARLWARKLAIKNIYDPAAGCVRCHATTVAGDAVAGVTCESCHGPGRGYAVLHQDPGTYQASVAAGMFDTKGKPDAWVRLCVSCHVMDDRRLIGAGHPSGDAFDAVKQVATVVHWKRVEPAAVVAAASRASMAEALARRLRPATTAAATVAPPAAQAATDTRGATRNVTTSESAVTTAEDQLLAALESLLRRNAYSPRTSTPPPLVAYTGPDADLLRLQQEIINLAIEALRTKPAPAPRKAP
jgi:cytochrome c5